ncbi:signal transduction histidine kinase [Aquimarina sp. EL_43]|uniref:ATP-binding protein n=1 Tax=unclassified Aquimarina TaxID=2627091 RepID=UPI0018CBC333|nr:MULTISPECIES: ATP-binding protein [unclassified Aquimarina]MBG6129524.1 signal transduction histidine kinase [Aquimarina sp. EL_35]MBG6150589.1 signal transduction histidine kinase [Aquimarina sp. EL_32]MBG6168103.1 signal transduction histidine kinase [Aquimarina sp. EL_43]
MKTEDKIKKELEAVLKAEEVDFQQFLELTSDFISYDNKHLRFRTDAGTIAHLGRDSIKDHTTAIIELVKNGYDADAEKVDIDIIVDGDASYIRIADSGSGMTEDEVINNWLRIGFSTKRINKKTKKNRRKTGEKGIGRLSADRLGSTINLITKSEEADVFGLEINWDDFNKQGVDLLLIPFNKIESPEVNLPEESKTGTEIIIRNLRNNWSDSDFKRLYEELSILTSPFKVIKDFLVTINTNIKTEYKGEVKPKEHLEPEVKLNVYYDGEGDEISYFISDKYGFGDPKKEKKIPWKLLSQKTNKKTEQGGYLNDFKSFDISDKKPTCGPVMFDLMFYPRESGLVKGTGFTLKQLREYLEYNGGVKIYRDNVSVKPYGFSGKDGEDWLNLGGRQAQNPAGIGRQDWMVKNNQMLGAIYINRDENQKLEDSAAREGLVHNEAYFDLRALVLCGVRLLELHRHNIHKEIDKGNQKTPRKSYKKILDDYKEELSKLKEELSELSKKAEENNHIYVLDASKSVDAVLVKTESTEKTIEEILNKNRTLGGLATIGIASAVFGHETQMSISQFKMANEEAIESLNEVPPNLDEALEELESAKHYSTHVSKWGSFALTRIKRDKRKRKQTDIKALLNNTIDEMNTAFKARGIKVSTDMEDVSAKTFPMDIETIIINLLTNSYSACLHNDQKREIKVELKNVLKGKQDGFEIVVSDSGNGVHEDFREIIWEALHTTKTDSKGNEIGTGLGLTIVQSIIDDLDGSREVENDKKLKGARFTIWLPKK